MNEHYAKCISFEKNVKGRIGGNPPENIEKQIPSYYKFYATLVHPEKENMMLSILVHEDFGTLLQNNIYPSVAIKVIEHQYSNMSDNSDKAIEDLSINSISDYFEQQDSEFQFIKVGGKPRFIQPKYFYYKKLEEDGYSFYLQIDEEGYRDDMDYVFMYGAL